MERMDSRFPSESIHPDDAFQSSVIEGLSPVVIVLVEVGAEDRNGGPM